MGATSIVLLALFAQASALPLDPQAKAKAQGLLDEGSRIYGEGDYAGALEKFTTAYAAYPSPKLMFNIGQANRDLGRPVEALHAFEKFLAEEVDASPETIADARASLAELRGKLGRILIDCQAADTEVSIDGKSVGLTPLPEPLWAAPGRHQVTAKHALAALALENLNVSAGSLHTVMLRLRALADPALAASAALAPPASAELTSASTAPEEPTSNQPLYAKWWVWTGAGAVLVGGVVTAFLLANRPNNPCSGIGYACLEIK
jgi:hypothetical protein